VIALFGNLSMLEVAFVAACSVMIFGRNLPRVAAQIFTHFQKARKALQTVWRDSGIGEEIRQVQREMERTAQTLREASPDAIARDAMREVETDLRRAGGSAVKAPVESSEPEAASEIDQPSDSEPDETANEESTDEPAAEASRRPPWYPDPTDDPFQAKPS
jgi:hypothetical protein